MVIQATLALASGSRAAEWLILLLACVILEFTIRNVYLILSPVPGTELLKPLEFPKC